MSTAELLAPQDLQDWRLGVVRREVFIVSAVGTPIGKFGGKLAHDIPPTLVWLRQRALERADVDPVQVGEAIFGSARPGPATAQPGSPDIGPQQRSQGVAGKYQNQACASGLKAIALGFGEFT